MSNDSGNIFMVVVLVCSAIVLLAAILTVVGLIRLHRKDK